MPNAGKTPPPYSWLGATNIANTLPSGVITYGATSYIPQTGRPLQATEIEPPGAPGGTGVGAPVDFKEEPWAMQGAAAAAAETPGIEAAEERAAVEAACKANPESCATDPYYSHIMGPQELVIEANGLRSLAGNSALLGAALKYGNIGEAPSTYAIFLLKWAQYFEAVANSLEHRKPGDAIAYLVREWTWHVHVNLLRVHINVELPYEFKTAYCWYKGSNRSGQEQFWCGKEGWKYM